MWIRNRQGKAIIRIRKQNATQLLQAVLMIRIRRIRMFLGLPDPHPDPLVTSTDPDPSIIEHK